MESRTALIGMAILTGMPVPPPPKLVPPLISELRAGERVTIRLKTTGCFGGTTFELIFIGPAPLRVIAHGAARPTNDKELPLIGETSITVDEAVRVDRVLAFYRFAKPMSLCTTVSEVRARWQTRDRKKTEKWVDDSCAVEDSSELLSLFSVASRADCAGKQAAGISERSEREFESRLGYRNDDGEFVPLVPDEALAGWGDQACQLAHQDRVDVSVAPDGTFRVPAGEETIGMARERPFNRSGTTAPPRCVEIWSWPCYRFRARGCEDLTVRMGPSPPPSLLELECPGRSEHAP